MLDSDLTRDVRLPVRIRRCRAGAEVRLAGVAGGIRDALRPRVLALRGDGRGLWLPGRVPGRARLPSYRMITDESADLVLLEAAGRGGPLVGARLEHPDKAKGRSRRLWSAAGVPVLATADGEAIQTVDLAAEKAGLRVAVRQPNALRAGGTFHGNVEWRIVGLSHARDSRARRRSVGDTGTRAPRTPARPPRLDLIVVDELGTVYGLT